MGERERKKSTKLQGEKEETTQRERMIGFIEQNDDGDHQTGVIGVTGTLSLSLTLREVDLREYETEQSRGLKAVAN